jgi:neutral ceramidase
MPTRGCVSRVVVGAVVLGGLMIVPSSPLRAEQAAWKIGVATARITPEKGKPLWMAGYGGRDRPAEGKLHDLWVKILALEAPDGRRAVLITSDVCGFSRVSYEAICAGVKRRAGLDPPEIMLSCSHTHSGPALRECLQDYYPMDQKQRALNDQYTRELEKTIVDKVAEAFAHLEPATLWAGEGRATFAVNRRNNPESEVPDLLRRGVALKGPVDHSVPVLAVRRPDGSLRAVVFGYACHATTLSGYQWCGDYPGFAQIDLEKRHPGALALFHAGCGGDQNPLPRRSVELCEKYGQMLAAAAEESLGKPMRPISPRLRTAMEVVPLDYQHTMTRPELEDYAGKGGLYGRWAKRMLKELDNGKTFAKSYPYPIGVWKLGTDQLWISLPGEAVVDYALAFKAKYGPHTWVTSFTQDLVGYIPSRRVWNEGGYEGGYLGEYGHPAQRWAPDVEDRITAAVQRLVDRVR